MRDVTNTLATPKYVVGNEPVTGTDGSSVWTRERSATIRSWAYPPLNLWEDDGNLYVEAELPGFELSELDITVAGEKQLSIKGERKEPETKDATWHRQERGYGSSNVQARRADGHHAQARGSQGSTHRGQMQLMPSLRQSPACCVGRIWSRRLGVEVQPRFEAGAQ